MQPANPFRRIHKLVLQERGMPGDGVSEIEKGQIFNSIDAMQAEVDNAVDEVQSVTGDISQLKTQVYDVRDYLTASQISGSTDARWTVINAIRAMPNDAILEFPAGVNLTSTGYIPIDEGKRVHLKGYGSITFTGNGDGSSARGGIWILGDGSSVEGLHLINREGDGTIATGPRQGIRVEAHNVTIRDTWVDGWYTGIQQTFNNGEWRGFICENNFVTDIYGGPYSGTPGSGDTNGDGIYFAGMDSIVRGNIVRARYGTSPRCGIVAEGGAEFNTPDSHGYDMTEHGQMIVNNVVEGPFSRAIHSEANHHTTIDGNIVYGMLWYGIVIWNAKSQSVTGNHVIWTNHDNVSPQPQIFQYAPRRAGIVSLQTSSGTTATISGNMINMARGNWNAGIYIPDYGTNLITSFLIANNTVQCSTKPAYAIRIEGAIGDSTVLRGNIVRGTTAGGGCENGISVDSSPTSTVFIENNHVFANVRSLQLNAVGTVIADSNVLMGPTSGNGISGSGELLIAKHNTFKFAAGAKGIIATGFTASYAPNNTFLGGITTANKFIDVTSTTAYGP